jgi:hypothetical protein
VDASTSTMKKHPTVGVIEINQLFGSDCLMMTQRTTQRWWTDRKGGCAGPDMTKEEHPLLYVEGEGKKVGQRVVRMMKSLDGKEEEQGDERSMV